MYVCTFSFCTIQYYSIFKCQCFATGIQSSSSYSRMVQYSFIFLTSILLARIQEIKISHISAHKLYFERATFFIKLNLF